MSKRRHFVNNPQINHSLHHSVRDGMAYSMMVGGGETYLTPFALFMKVTIGQVALLSTLPPLIGSLAQFLSVWMDRHIQRRKPVIICGVLLQAMVWPLLLLAAFLLTGEAYLSLLGLLVLYHAGAHLAAPPWTRLMGDLVPERRRGRYFAYRTRLTSVTTLFAMIVSGVVLDYFDTRGSTGTGFGIIFAMAFIARLVSAYQIKLMHEPPHPQTDATADAIPLLKNKSALQFTLYFVLMQMVVAIASPFFAVYMLEHIHFTYLQFMANTCTAVVIQFITLNWWGRLGDVFGHRIILMLTGITIPLLPLLWVVSDNFWYLIPVQVLSGFVWGGFNLACINLLFDLVPIRKRLPYTAIHNVLTATGVFIGATIGILLINVLPERATWLGNLSLTSTLLNVFLVSSLLRFLVTIFFIRKVREQRKVRRPRLQQEHIFRMTRFNAFLGLMYEFIADTPIEDRDGRPDSKK